jgi:hypothetical protein|tara:strand:- start:619 stop:867 length:249 start_codon:yes stop_codon:yes gene_type:complete
MPKTKGILTDKNVRDGGKIIDIRITPDKKRQVYLEIHKRKTESWDKILTTDLISEIEVTYDEYALVKEGKGNTLVVKKIRVV